MLKRTAIANLATGFMLAFSARLTHAIEDYVQIESVTTLAGTDSVRIGIAFGNVEALTGLYIPLEIRSLNASAFVEYSSSVKMNPVGRLFRSPLVAGDCYPNDPIWIEDHGAPDSLNVCSGPVSSSYGTGTATQNAL